MILLETERLYVRDYVESDLHDLHGMLSDRQNMYFLDDIVSNTLEDTRQNLQSAMANANGHYFCLRHKESGVYVGSVGYDITAKTPVGKIVHMGYFTLPAFQRQGYTAEAVRRILAFAFNEDNCVRVTTGCYKDNVPSRKVMEKAGFKKEGEHSKAAWHDGQLKDRLDYALNRDEFNL